MSHTDCEIHPGKGGCGECDVCQKYLQEKTMSPNDVRSAMGLSEYEVTSIPLRSLTPTKWWQFRFRYRLWRFSRDAAKQEDRLIALIGKELHDEVKRELEHQILIGPGDGT